MKHGRFKERTFPADCSTMVHACGRPVDGKWWLQWACGESCSSSVVNNCRNVRASGEGRKEHERNVDDNKIKLGKKKNNFSELQRASRVEWSWRSSGKAEQLPPKLNTSALNQILPRTEQPKPKVLSREPANTSRNTSTVCGGEHLQAAPHCPPAALPLISPVSPPILLP